MNKQTTTLKELLIKTRSIRRFDPEVRISGQELEDLVSYAVLCPCGGNYQPLRYLCVSDRSTCEKIFPHLKWAARLGGWQPSEAEQPAAYILILIDREIAQNAPYDSGIAAHAILMAAAEEGIAGCMLGNVNRKETAALLGIDTEKYVIDLCVALGKAAEVSEIVEMKEDSCYYRNENGVFCVPKQSAPSVILN